MVQNKVVQLQKFKRRIYNNQEINHILHLSNINSNRNSCIKNNSNNQAY